MSKYITEDGLTIKLHDFVLAQIKAYNEKIAAAAYVAKEEGKSLVSDEDITQITTNKTDLETLMGEGEGSVKKLIDAAFNDFATKVSDDEVVNTFKELVDYVAEHAPEAAAFAADIETLKGAATVEGSVAKAILDAIGTLGNDAEGTPFANVKAYVDAKIAASGLSFELADIDFDTEW